MVSPVSLVEVQPRKNLLFVLCKKIPEFAARYTFIPSGQNSRAGHTAEEGKFANILANFRHFSRILGFM